MHAGTPHATVTGQRQSLIKRRDQFWAIVALLVFVLITLVIIDGRVTSLVARLQGINQDLGYLRPVLNLFGLGIVLALGWVVWRRILELPFPEFLKDKRILGIAKYALVVSALVIAGIEAGTRWLPTVVKTEAATFSLPLSLLILALLIQTLQRVLSGPAGREGGESKGESSGRMGLVFSVLGILVATLLCGWLLLKIQGVIWAQGASHRMDLATEAERRVRLVLAQQVAHTWHGFREATEHQVELRGTNWSRTIPLPVGMKSDWTPKFLGLRVQANESFEISTTGVTVNGNIQSIRFRLTSTNGALATNILFAVGY